MENQLVLRIQTGVLWKENNIINGPLYEKSKALFTDTYI